MNPRREHGSVDDDSSCVRTPDEISSRAWEKETDGLRARRESRRRVETAMPSPSRARIFARGGGEICQVSKLAKLDAKLLGSVFS